MAQDPQYLQYRQMRDMIGMRQLMQQQAQSGAPEGGQDPFIAPAEDPAAMQQPQGVDPNQPVSPENPAQDPTQTGAPDPMEVLPQVILSIMDFTMGIVNDKTIDAVPKAQILQQQGDAIATLMKIITDQQAAQADPQQSQMQMAELAMKQQVHEQNIQMSGAKHTQELQMAQEKHAMDMQKAGADLQQKAVQTVSSSQQDQQKINHTEEMHNQKLVHNEKTQELKAQQVKQAAQSKQTSKQGSNKGKK